MGTLKQFIKAVRAAKTAADERAIIQKESAVIRAFFREESNNHYYRRNNLSKLLYLYILGECTHFGQIECLRLLASPLFADKRLGYLGTMLLLDENQEVLMLVTNSLKNDLNHSNPYIVGLALCTLGNIASPETARDLFLDIERLMNSPNVYIRKKAALCAMRIIQKVPDFLENFIDHSKLLLKDKNHGVLLCGLTLIIDICIHNPNMIKYYRPLTSYFVNQLKSLVNSTLTLEYDVSGITDPFLQIKFLRMLRVLGHGDVEISEQINDILAQVATNTESTKNVGNSILYETVLTILDIETNKGLRVLGVNILGKFLSDNDNNIKYIALNTLNKVISIEPNAVQRHRSTVLKCLRDPDISIRRRALDLSFALINESNIRILVRELLAFLETADNEFKLNMTTQISIAANKFAPNKRWHIDTILRILKLAGNYIKEHVFSSFIQLIITTPELQSYTIRKLFFSLQKNLTQEALTLVGIWTIGEYGELLLQPYQSLEEELNHVIKVSDILELFENIIDSNYCSKTVMEYLMTSLMKLSVRIKEQPQIEKIRSLLRKYSTSIDIEIQQRSLEYERLFQFDEIREEVLKKMPPLVIKDSEMFDFSIRKVKSSKETDENLLFDLFGDDFFSKKDSNDINNDKSAILEILGSLNHHKSLDTEKNVSVFAQNSESLGTSVDSVSSKLNKTIGDDIYTVYEKNSLRFTLQIDSLHISDMCIIAITNRFLNVGFTRISKINLQAAVIKSQKLQMYPISGTFIEPGGNLIQTMKITASKGSLLRLRFKIIYNCYELGDVVEQVDFNQFPHNLLS
ncbi:hypothetical protein T552_00149 [Pneumocystis carinii B80]|uniref:AP-1 complex subunit gamma n=1 Tax=Pneumocystis carinii (strain B80) TaxID=1408658 RepID=A0A0W4ZT11_PNEC8|nr:hypothetical protein T552_00149 [Pneumocystis carinii B80]KTW31507.1 hypothetical protein T552_00149 [Pneumocystis carinii B80]